MKVNKGEWMETKGELGIISGELGIISGIGYGQRFIIKRLGAIPAINGYLREKFSKGFFILFLRYLTFHHDNCYWV